MKVNRAEQIVNWCDLAGRKSDPVLISSVLLLVQVRFSAQLTRARRPPQVGLDLHRSVGADLAPPGGRDAPSSPLLLFMLTQAIGHHS